MRSKRMRFSRSPQADPWQAAATPLAGNASRSLRPVHVRMLMRDRHQHVQRAVAGRRHGVDRCARVLDVERRVVGQHVPVLDVVEVLPVISRRRKCCGARSWSKRPSTPRYSMKVEQEISLLRELRVRSSGGAGGPARAVVIAWAKSALTTTASARCSPLAVRTPTARRPSNRISSTRSFRRIVDARARSATRAMSRVTRVAAADRMPDAVFVFEEGEDGEQARALERRHAEVLRLERERELQARVVEVARQLRVQRLPRLEETAAPSAGAA